MITNSKMGLAYALLASGLLVRDNGLSDKEPEPAQTNAVVPVEPMVESRQVRRQRERLARKGRAV